MRTASDHWMLPIRSPKGSVPNVDQRSMVANSGLDSRVGQSRHSRWLALIVPMALNSKFQYSARSGKRMKNSTQLS